MKTRVGRNTPHLLMLLMLALCVVVVATSIAPSMAHARVHQESTTPLMGDPDTPEAPTTVPSKAAGISRDQTTLRTGMKAATSSTSHPRISWNAARLLLGAWLVVRRFY